MNPSPAVLSSIELQFFAAMPGNSALLLPDAPQFTIVAVTDDYLHTAGRAKEELIGKGLFEVFPNPPDDPERASEKKLRASLAHVLTQKSPHSLPIYQYDMPTADGDLKEQHWSITNKPILSEAGEVLFIIYSAVEVTGQVVAEKRLQAIWGFEKAYDFFMAAPVIVGFVRGDDYTIELANERLLGVWGRGPEVIAKPMFTAIPELAEQGFKALLDEVRTSGEVFTANEYPITLNRQGKQEVLYFDFIYKPFYEDDTQSRAGGVISVGHDVTAQVLAKRKIEESEAKYRTLFESMDQGFCVLEMIFNAESQPVDYRFLETNPVFKEQTGLQNAVGKTVRQLVPNLEPHWFDLYGNVALTGKSIRFTEGSTVMGRWFDVSGFPIGEPQHHRVALLFTDITERKNAEEAIRRSESNLRNMILQSPVAMAILRGPFFVVEIANDRMFELWGRPKEELLNKSIFEGLPEVKNQGYEELLMGVYQSGQTFSALGIPVTVPRTEGIQTIYINLLYEAFREADGTISGIMAVATDVTEQVLARQKIEEVVAERTKELAKANKELTRSNQNLEEFAYAASHDLKEPIRKIHVFSDRLKSELEDQLTETQKQLFERLEHASRRMGILIDDLLAYSHTSRGVPEVEEVDLNKKVRLVLEDLEVEVQQKGAKVTAGPLPTVRANRRQMQQLFQNLITNALKYSKANIRPEIQIKARDVFGKNVKPDLPVDDADKQFYLIEVSDNGIGFEQEYAERIFHVFTRLHGNSEYSGTGVGLSIVQKVVQNHGGYIWARSNPGVGASFNVLLPIR